MKLLAIITDTFRESLARKTILGFFGLSTLFLLIALIFFLAGQDLLLKSQPAMMQKIPMDELMQQIVVGVESVIARLLYAPAILLSIFATASIIPNTLEKGSIDLLLSKPVSRTEILVGKILGASTIVFLNVTYYIVGMWLIISLTTGVWNPAFLLAIFPIVFGYLVLFSIALFIGVTARSSALAILLVYFLFIIVVPILTARELTLYTFITNAGIKGVLDTLYYILPKTDDIANACSFVVENKKIAAMPIWSSALFSLAVFTGSLFLFRKKDF